MQDRPSLYYVSRFGAGADSALNPFVLVLLLIAGILMFTKPVKWTSAPIILLSFLLPMGQGLILGPFHLPVFRIMVGLGWARVLWCRLSSSTFMRLSLNSLDKVILLFASTFTVEFSILYGFSNVFVNRLGFLYTVLGSYFLFRILVRDNEDIKRVLKTLAVVCMVLAACMLREKITGQNFFGYFGGVPIHSAIRDGRLRSQGSFAHPVLAGTFSSTVAGLFVALWYLDRKSLEIALCGLVSAIMATITSASSTPLLSLTGAAIAFCLWPLRQNMRIIRWCVLLVVVTLHLAMKAPVWALITHIDIIGGSSGFHRFALIDQTIRHFSDWWFCGVQDSGTWGWEMWDTSNTYVDVAVQGGLVTLALFIAVLIYGFKRLGAARERTEMKDRRQAAIMWTFGCALFSNSVAFIGITYFDQTVVMWYLLLAMIAAVTTVGSTSGRQKPPNIAQLLNMDNPVHIEVSASKNVAANFLFN